MESIQTRQSFAQFVAKFPPVEMPVTLGEDTHHVFITENLPLPEDMIRQFILQTEPEGTDLDEFTEFVPCFAIDGTEKFIALVWWKAELLHYRYTLATFTDKGKLIDHRVIAHTLAGENLVEHRLATINDELEIFIAEGRSRDGITGFDPTTSRTYVLEILVNGEIVA